MKDNTIIALTIASARVTEKGKASGGDFLSRCVVATSSIASLLKRSIRYKVDS